MTNPPTVDIEEGRRLLAEALRPGQSGIVGQPFTSDEHRAGIWFLANGPALLTAASQAERYLGFARSWQTKAEQLEELLNEAITALDDVDPRLAEQIAAVLHHPETDQVQP